MGSESDRSQEPKKRPEILQHSLKSLRELQLKQTTPKVTLGRSISGASLNLNLCLKKQISNPKNE